MGFASAAPQHGEGQLVQSVYVELVRILMVLHVPIVWLGRSRLLLELYHAPSVLLDDGHLQEQPRVQTACLAHGLRLREALHVQIVWLELGLLLLPVLVLFIALHALSQRIIQPVGQDL